MFLHWHLVNRNLFWAMLVHRPTLPKNGIKIDFGNNSCIADCVWNKLPRPSMVSQSVAVGQSNYGKDPHLYWYATIFLAFSLVVTGPTNLYFQPRLGGGVPVSQYFQPRWGGSPVSQFFPICFHTHPSYIISLCSPLFLYFTQIPDALAIRLFPSPWFLLSPLHEWLIACRLKSTTVYLQNILLRCTGCFYVFYLFIMTLNYCTNSNDYHFPCPLILLCPLHLGILKQTHSTSRYGTCIIVPYHVILISRCKLYSFPNDFVFYVIEIRVSIFQVPHVVNSVIFRGAHLGHLS